MKLLLLSHHMVSNNWILNFFETWLFDYDHITSNIFARNFAQMQKYFWGNNLDKSFSWNFLKTIAKMEGF